MSDIRDKEKMILPQLQYVFNLWNKHIGKPVERLSISSLHEDTKLSFDVAGDNGTQISLRWRKNNPKYPIKDITVRSKSSGGGPTEIDKIEAGLGMYGFYYNTEDKECKVLNSYIFYEWDKLRHILREREPNKNIGYDNTELTPIWISRMYDCGAVLFASQDLRKLNNNTL